MRLLKACLASAALAGCGGSDATPPSATDSGAKLYSTILEDQGIPYEVSWDRSERTRATVRVVGVPEALATDPSNVVALATGCAVIGRPVRVPVSDGVATFMLETACNPTEVRSEIEASVSRELAREIDLALALVGNERKAEMSAPNAPTALHPLLFEGSPFAAFDADDIERFCAETWETRIGADGRTEYNPCKRRDAFR